MAEYRISQVIRRPVADVFNTVIHLEQFPSWNPARNPSGRRVSGGEIGEGSRFELEIKGFGIVRQELQEFFRQHGVRSVAMSEGNMGCPHEEGEDFPEGEDCPFCPFWKGKQGSKRRD